MGELFVITKDEMMHLYSVSFRDLLGYIAAKYGVDTADTLQDLIEDEPFKEMKRAEKNRSMINRDILINVIMNTIQGYEKDVLLQEKTETLANIMAANALCDYATIAPVSEKEFAEKVTRDIDF